MILGLPAVLPADEPSAGFLLERWMAVETALYDYGISEAGAGPAASPPALDFAIGAFRDALDVYIASPSYIQYEGIKYLPGDQKTALFSLLEELSAAAAAGDRRKTGESAAAIRDILLGWQKLDDRVTNIISIWFFYLLSLFLFIMTALFIIAWVSRRALWKSRQQEQDTSVFSRRILMAQEAERSRIAAELHDTVLQDLGRLLRLLRKYTPPPENTGVPGEEALPDLGLNIIDQIRRICLAMMPPDFSRPVLAGALAQLAADFEKRTDIPCYIKIPDDAKDIPLPPETQLLCYRIVQEAFTNIEKHAHATAASLTVRKEHTEKEENLIVCVSDNGVGLSGSFPGKSGVSLGIRGMYERMAILGGELSFSAEEGEGVSIRMEIPLRA
jgi:signal transduction histidine kinase